MVREGFLHDGDPLDNEYAIPVPKPPYRRQNGEKTTIGLVSVYNKTVEPLSNRGWAFQGKLLSSRVTEYGCFQTRCILMKEDETRTDDQRQLLESGSGRPGLVFR
jgi:hypothetical protein